MKLFIAKVTYTDSIEIDLIRADHERDAERIVMARAKFRHWKIRDLSLRQANSVCNGSLRPLWGIGT